MAVAIEVVERKTTVTDNNIHNHNNTSNSDYNIRLLSNSNNNNNNRNIDSIDLVIGDATGSRPGAPPPLPQTEDPETPNPKP